MSLVSVGEGGWRIFVYKYLIVQILEANNKTLQYSRVPQLPSTQSKYVMDFTFFCSQTDIAVLHPGDGIVRVRSGTRL